MRDEDFFTVSFVAKEGDDKLNPHRHVLIASVGFLEQFAWSDDLQLGNAPACKGWGRDCIGIEPSCGGMEFTNHDPAVVMHTLGLRAMTFSAKHQSTIIDQLKTLSEFVRDTRVRAYGADEILKSNDE